MLEQVTLYIDERVLHSKVFDVATESQKKKAINQAIDTLMKYIPEAYRELDAPPVHDVAEQALWLLKIDDSIQRAELGVSTISVDGVSMNLQQIDRTISPKILNLYGLRDTKRRRVARYSDEFGFRTGMPNEDNWRYRV